MFDDVKEVFAKLGEAQKLIGELQDPALRERVIGEVMKPVNNLAVAVLALNDNITALAAMVEHQHQHLVRMQTVLELAFPAEAARVNAAAAPAITEH